MNQKPTSQIEGWKINVVLVIGGRLNMRMMSRRRGQSGEST